MKRGDWWKIVCLVLIWLLIYKFINKQILMGFIYQSLPYREAGLMAGILLGDKGGFDKIFYEQLKASGLVHLVVASGSNVMLLVGGMIEGLSQFGGRKKTIVLGLAIGWWYAGLAGGEVPVVRAMLLVSVLYFAQLVGRKYNLFRGVLLTVLLMVLAEVRVLTSVSFWLSMAAFGGVISGKALGVFGKTVWVSLWITPILGMVFGKISLIAPLTNLLVMEVIEITTTVGMLGMALGLLLPVGGQAVLWLCWPWLRFLERVVVWGGNSGMVLNLRFNWPMLLGWYLVLVYGLKRINEKNKSVVGG